MKYHLGQSRSALRGRYFKFFTVILTLTTLVVGRFYISQIVGVTSNEVDAQSTNSGQAENRVAPASLSLRQPAGAITPDLSDKIQGYLETLARQYNDATISIVVEAIDNTFEAKLIPQQQMGSASLYKTVAAYKVLQRVDAGELTLDQWATGDQNLEQCLELAITVSDNPCGIALQRLSLPDVTNDQLIDWGYLQTELAGYHPLTSAQDQHHLLQDIYLGNRLSDESRDLLMRHLQNQRITNRTPDYDGATFYHKTGDFGGAVHSVGLVDMGDSVYTISILTDNWNLPLLSKYSVIEDVHRSVYELVSQHASI